MVYKCDLCNLQSPNESQFKQHLEGKKHKKLESIKEEREKSSLRSLFVSGLKKDIFIKNLEEYFQKYGKIHKIIIDKDKHAYAIVEFENENSVEAALKDSEHKINDRNIKIKRRQTKEFVSKIANNSDKKKEALEKSRLELIAINGFLSKCSNFDEQVSKFIDYSKISDKEFQNRNEVCNQLNNLLKKYIQNSNVCIFGSTATGLATNGSDMDVTILLDNYLELNKYKQLKIPVHKNGSLKSQTSSGNNSVEGENNGTPIEIDNQEIEGEEEEEEYLTETQFEEKYKNLLNLELEEQIKIIAKLIQRYGVDLQDIRKITNSRCPIIRFFNEKFQINCDITLNNFLAVENTNLIKVLLELEPMLKNLIYVIRYWSKQKGLNGTFKFNSYTLIWLIVFYLQKINRLPTVEFLAKLCDENNKNLIIHGWDCRFEKNIAKIKNVFKAEQNENLNSFNNLLKGFFDFYSIFNFSSSSVLSTRSGSIVSSDNSVISKKGCINIQDPFDLEHNLSANINEAVLERFKIECSQANNVLKYCLTPHKPAANGIGKQWGLSMLFTRKTPDMIAPKEHVSNCLENGIRIKLNLNNNNYDKNLIGAKETDFVLYLLNSCLLFDVKKEELNDENFEFKRKRLPVLNQICTKVDSMGLNCSPKRLRVSDEPDKYVCIDDIQKNFVDDEDEDDFKSSKLLSIYKVSVKKNTWQGRRNVKRELLKQENDKSLDFEKNVSLKLCEENNEKITVNQEDIDFKLNIYLLNQINDYYLSLKCNVYDNDDCEDDQRKNSQKIMNFTTLVHFLDTYLNNSYQKYFDSFKKDK